MLNGTVCQAASPLKGFLYEVVEARWRAVEAGLRIAAAGFAGERGALSSARRDC